MRQHATAESGRGNRRDTLTRRRLLAGMIAAAATGGSWWLTRSEAVTGPVTRDQYGDQIQTVPRGQLPDFARSGGVKVQEAYRYALQDGEALDYIPCFCGCKNIGHRHNRDCYIKSANRDGTVTYTSHAATWTICLDITRDVMRLRGEKRPLGQIRAYIDRTYGASGPSTPTPRPKS